MYFFQLFSFLQEHLCQIRIFLKMDEQSGETAAILFNDLIPLPFRILLLIQFLLLLWLLLNIILYNFSSLNVLHLINLSYSQHNYTQLDHLAPTTFGEFATTIPADLLENARLIKGIWLNLKRISLVNFISWFAFKAVKWYNKDLTLLYYSIPVVLFAYVFHRLFYANVNTAGQVRVYTTMKRVLQGGINSLSMRTNDILISDSLVSVSKVLNDFGLFIWNYYVSESIAYNYQLEFLILCIPTFIRIKQCWFEYSSTGKTQHMLNLIKYSTAFGPLLINALIKHTLLRSSDEDRQSGALIQQLTKLNKWWYFLSALNSTYSFIWDIMMDWHLQLFNKLFNPRERFTILRPHKAFPDYIYLIAMSIDFLLRYIWVLKLFIINEELRLSSQIKFLHVFSTFLFGYDAYSFGYVIIEVLEIFRRWVWCFVKLESDWIKVRYEEPREFELSGMNEMGKGLT